ncbi:efflux RND transporter permease subunit [Caulobacter sp. 17J80-11]|uniref:efflux RND transporter permease subunit n=1 Tax=Caulobacter sp. 17J80-11 TaxID=2763502 RepID=UPI001653A4B5|nr:multidrug efflux RND transporter permease subunit [Caulobacter sp. 17J80-11]MBC6982075.1 multidrug efflux RND transporter permease subunit [Caulobacter sp. 17J80-11]
MRLSRFFIDRPIFATVLSVVITLVGILAIRTLPLSEYPEVVPPTITVTAAYPGASPETIAETVAAPLEQSINGVENMLYLGSQSTADGRLTVTVTFKLGTDLDDAQVLVQNRVSTAQARLPEEVRRLGVTVAKSSPNLMMVVHMLSPDERYDQIYVSNYTTLKVRDELARLKGAGDVVVFGARDYAMRIWLDPEKIAARGLTAGDVLAGLRRQNIQVAAGSVGAEPQPNGAQFQLTVEAPGRLVEPEAFEDVVVATGRDGALVRVRDVGRVELGAENYTSDASLGGKPAVAVAVFQRPGSNALETGREVEATMQRLSKDFPQGLEYKIVYDTTKFVSTSIHEVQKTLLEAVLLVVVVVFVFLQSWRAALIPVLAIPVSVVGTFALLTLTGGSINTLSLFGLILAIGIVVDDAIVVVENVERNIARGLSPKEAARVSMDEVGGALIAIALVLTAVFVPVGFIGGVAGQFYKQFALTIATATLISAFVSLTLSPALCAVLLKPHAHDREPKAWEKPLHAFFGAFNRGFDILSDRYGLLTKRAVRYAAIVLVVYGGLVLLTGGLFQMSPKGFVPAMDRGYGFVAIQLPQGASLQRTREVTQEVSTRVRSVKGVVADPGFVGYSGATGTQATNSATVFFTFAPFDERAKTHRTQDAILNDVRKATADIQDAFVLVIAPPAVQGLGSGSGVKMMIQDREGKGYAALADASFNMMMAANQTPGVANAFTFYEARTPRLKLEVDRDKAEALRVPVSEVNQALEVYLGSAYVNDFNYLGRTFRVTAQADGQFRQSKEDIGRLWVRSLDGQMVPLSAVTRVAETAGPSRVPRYNLYPAAELNAEPAPGTSSGQLIAKLETLAAKTLPAGMSYEWTELGYIQKTESGGTLGIFLLAAFFVFLVLAAQYESLTLPLAVILIVPMSILGALVGLLLRGLDVNVLTQIALIVLVGLAAKNAVLIVEFAKQLEDQEGLDPFAAAAKSAGLRLRPILMTSLAFILGVTPLVFAHGAGAEQRVAIGTAVFAGMIGVTLIGLVLTPVFYVVTRRLSALIGRLRADPAAPADAHAAE